ncbi:MAG: hypothetical protein EP329_02975 [Deltaproteobacteria bacterium]|nr:MAG: hypothetical protein EP329_02975 [Deltaproteobacteria bacterium]
MSSLRALALALLAATAPACMGPLVSDEVPPGEIILPAGADVPAATGAVAAKIAANDGVDGLIPLQTAFGDGAPVRFWDFGPTTPVAAPIWFIVEDDPEGSFSSGDRTFAPVGQLNVVDAVPGDPAYGPFWEIILVPVTDRWDGEVFASAQAIDAGVAAGLLEPPIALPLAVNCPIVAPETRLDRGPDQDPKAPSPGYYRGVIVTYFAFDIAPLDAAGEVATAPVYELRREGGEPLDEGVRGVDITGDGDHVDSNDLFAAPRGEDAYTGLVTPVDVVVRADYASIDTSGDDATADLTDAAQLFTASGDPDPTWVVAFYPGDGVYNRPIQREENR